MAVGVSPFNFASFSIAAILVCVTCMVYMTLHNRFEKLQSKLFMIIIVDLAVTALCGMVAELFNPRFGIDPATLPLVLVSNYIYFPAHMLLGPLFCLYVFVLCGGSIQWRRNAVIGLSIPFAIVELLSLTNPLTRWVYYYGPNMEFVRNWAMYILYGLSLLYMVMGVFILMHYWSAITRRKRLAITYFFIMAAIGVAVQLFAPTVRVELFAESVAVLGVMLFVEDETEFIDSETSVYNRSALKMSLDRFSAAKRPYYLITVNIVNADNLVALSGSDRMTHFMSATADYLKTLVPWYQIYRPSTACFVVIDPEFDNVRALEVAQKISRRFDQGWTYGGAELKMNASVSLACVPDDLPTPTDALYLIDTPTPPVSGKRVLAGKDLEHFIRQIEVERALRRGFEEKTYEMYYQPVYNSDGTLHAAEALMRLHDSVLGDIPPDEFIAVAERTGLIDELGDFALEQVCGFISSGIPQKLGLRHITVNLSVVQCMQVGFANKVKKLIEGFDVQPAWITFEITESVAASNHEMLQGVMESLKANGHLFAMDDYGTGYSNMHSFITLDFDMVKVDKSVLWDAEKNQTGMAILENSVNMLKSVDSTVLVEGVETEKQVEMLRTLGVNYFQGFYFARPMPVEDLVAQLAADGPNGANGASA